MKNRADILNILAHATGTTQYHRFSPIEGYPVATDGVNALAQAAECYWLLDAIGSHQSNRRLDPDFQVWQLLVNQEDSNAVLSGYNDDILIVEQQIMFTDFPLDKIKLWLVGGVIMLPTEY